MTQSFYYKRVEINARRHLKVVYQLFAIQNHRDNGVLSLYLWSLHFQARWLLDFFQQMPKAPKTQVLEILGRCVFLSQLNNLS